MARKRARSAAGVRPRAPIHSDSPSSKSERRPLAQPHPTECRRNFGPVMRWRRRRRSPPCTRRRAASDPEAVVTRASFRAASHRRVATTAGSQGAGDSKGAHERKVEPRRDGGARGARHSRRRRRQPRHRPADDGRQPPARRPRGRPAQRERRHRHGPGAARRRRGLRPHQRREAAGVAAAGRLVLPPRRQLRDDARLPSRRLRPRRVPGLGGRRPRQLAHRRGRRDSGRRRGDGPRHRREEDLRDDGARDQGRRAQDRRALQLSAHRIGCVARIYTTSPSRRHTSAWSAARRGMDPRHCPPAPGPLAGRRNDPAAPRPSHGRALSCSTKKSKLRP